MAATQVAANLGDMERAAVEDALTRSGGNLSRAAAILGISRQALYRRMDKYNLRP